MPKKLIWDKFASRFSTIGRGKEQCTQIKKKRHRNIAAPLFSLWRRLVLNTI
jgi:hypothetical protein